MSPSPAGLSAATGTGWQPRSTGLCRQGLGALHGVRTARFSGRRPGRGAARDCADVLDRVTSLSWGLSYTLDQFTHILGLYPLEASSIPRVPIITCPQTLPNVPYRAKWPQLKHHCLMLTSPQSFQETEKGHLPDPRRDVRTRHRPGPASRTQSRALERCREGDMWV